MNARDKIADIIRREVSADVSNYGLSVSLDGVDEAAAAIASDYEAETNELSLWRAGKLTLGFMPDGHPCIMHHPEDPNAEVRDSETGEVIFPAVKAPFRVIEGVCVCVARGDGPEGCGICNETGKPPGNPSSASEGVG